MTTTTEQNINSMTTKATGKGSNHQYTPVYLVWDDGWVPVSDKNIYDATAEDDRWLLYERT